MKGKIAEQIGPVELGNDTLYFCKENHLIPLSSAEYRRCVRLKHGMLIMCKKNWYQIRKHKAYQMMPHHMFFCSRVNVILANNTCLWRQCIGQCEIQINLKLTWKIHERQEWYIYSYSREKQKLLMCCYTICLDGVSFFKKKWINMKYFLSYNQEHISFLMICILYLSQLLAPLWSRYRLCSWLYKRSVHHLLMIHFQKQGNVLSALHFPVMMVSVRKWTKDVHYCYLFEDFCLKINVWSHVCYPYICSLGILKAT